MNETLTLYVAISEIEVSEVLVLGKSMQTLVFCHFKAFQGVEINYAPIKKLAFAVVMTTHHLCPYFQAHPIIISTEYLLLQTLQKPSISGWLAKWAIKLSGYDSKFIPTTVMKAQAWPISL